MTMAQTVVDALVEGDYARQLISKSFGIGEIVDRMLTQAKWDIEDNWFAEVRPERSVKGEASPNFLNRLERDKEKPIVLVFTVRVTPTLLSHEEHMANYLLRKWKKSRSKKKGNPPDVPAEMEGGILHHIESKMTGYAWHAGLDSPGGAVERTGDTEFRATVWGAWPHTSSKRRPYDLAELQKSRAWVRSPHPRAQREE